jgi:quercetin dioxygenase-like cupin family protein
MNTGIKPFMVNDTNTHWKPLVEDGHHYAGVGIKSLRYEEVTQRSPSVPLKFEAGAPNPYHNHPGGEEILVIDGSCRVDEAELKAGDHWYTHPDSNMR